MAFFKSMWGRAFGFPGAPQRTEGLQTGLPAYADVAASKVSFDSAMQISAVWAAVRMISETIGSLPFNILEVGDDGKKIAVDHDLQKILTKTPNQYQTNVEFWESMALNLVVSGNAYAIKQMSNGRLIGLLPISSSQVETTLLSGGGVAHAYTQGVNVNVYSAESIWHVKLFGNGVVGMSPLSYARNSIGIAQAADNRTSKIFSNGAKPSGVLTIDRTLTSEQRTQVKAAFSGLESGDQDRLFVLEAGMNYQQVSMSPQDIELLNARRFQIEDIGRFFGVPSILLNQTFGQSSLGSNVFEILTAFYKLNLRPYLEKFEASTVRWLIDPADQDKYEARFDFDALLRADTLSRMKANKEAINSGQLTPNEGRIAEGRQGLPGGDVLLIQGAMIPIETAGNPKQGTTGLLPTEKEDEQPA